MSYTNGILNHDDSQGLGKIGSRGLPGIGFKFKIQIMIMICKTKNWLM